MKKNKTHKRHFQLLELMVAAFILLVCIAPTMRIFTSMYLSQNEIIRENQRDHLAHMAHAKVTEMLYKHQIPIDDSSEKRVIPINDTDLNELLDKFSYSCKVTLALLPYTPKGQEKPTEYLGTIVIKMKDIAHKSKKNSSFKKSEDQVPSETFYDYIVYIDSGAKKLNEEKNKNGTDSDKSANTKPFPDKSFDIKGAKQLKDPFSNTKEVEKNNAKGSLP